MRALSELSTEKYRRDVISGNVADYIKEGLYRNTVYYSSAGLIVPIEYTKARSSLGEVSDESFGTQYSLRTTPSWDILSGVVGDLPMVSVYPVQQ